MQLSPAVALTTWLNAVVAGTAAIDHAVAAVTADAPNSVVVAAGHPTLPLRWAIRDWLGAGLDGARLALPAPGDPVGLAGPPEFNRAALTAGEAVLLPALGTGVVPEVDARVLVWTVHTATAPQAPPDPGEADVMLRQSLHRATSRLAELDVASWRPEIPDVLLNVRNRLGAPLPAATPPRWLDTVDRALLCLEIIALARRDDGGAVSAFEMQARRACLTDLDRAARRALVAVCSDSLGPT